MSANFPPTFAVTKNGLPKALLVSLILPGTTEAEAKESVEELERLVTTLGFRVIGKEYQRRAKVGGTVVGSGKLAQLARYTGGPGEVVRDFIPKKSGAHDEPETDDDEVLEEAVDVGDRAEVVVFDCDLSPSQLRNVESALAVEVFDRSGVIIEIFSRHAKTRTAKLQVEIARLNYLAPRLRESSGGQGERQAGRGAGESQLELDRRNIRDRILELKTELETVQREQVSRRTQRNEQFCVALVGYTNAGKSSLMRALTGSEVLVQDKLFATLDTTVRALHPETHPRILVSDTVGFIKKLPHDLVASFRSTLDEALNASLLLFVVDISGANFLSELEVSRKVLDEVGVEGTPNFVVFNKIDRVDEENLRHMKREFPTAFFMSARHADDVKALRQKIVEFCEKDMHEDEIFARYDVKGIVGEVRGSMRVIAESFEAEGVRMKVKAHASELARIKRRFDL